MLLRKGSFPFLVLEIFFALSVTANSQPLPNRPASSDNPTQSVYIEFGGAGTFYTANYDVIFDNGWGFRLGGAYLPEEIYRSQYSKSSYYGTDLLVILLMGEYITGNGPNKFESSLGIMLGESNLKDADIAVPDPPGLAASFGYRYLPTQAGKVTFKAAFTPVIADGRIYPKFGVSIGFILSQEQD